MAIFDSEKRPRGLRMPSLTAMKQGTAAAARSQFSFSSKKSNEPRTPDEDPPPTSSGDSFAPPEAAPPPTKDLPAIPRDQLPPPPRISPNVPARREVGSNAHPGQTSPTSPQGRRRPAPPMIDTAPLSEPQPEFQPQPPMRSERRLQPELRTSPQSPQSQMQPQPQEQPQWQFSPPTPPPVTLSPPTVQGNEDETPLEDFIPTPDPGSPLEPVSSDEPAPPDTPPLELEVVAAPLTKVHFACFQEHRNMPVSQNVWCPVPCMTCQKFDREIRHRCVFCCLRICGSCHQALMKCKDRSLEELMESLNRD